MPHLGLAPLHWLVFALATTVGLRLAQAEPAAQPSVAEPAAQPPVAVPAAQPPVTEPAAQPPVTEPAAQPSVTEPPVAEPAAQPPVAEPAAQPPVADAAAKPGPGEAAQPARSGFEVLASVGWGTSTGDVRKLTLSPYGTTTGLDVGYSWQSGFRLGGYFAYSLGRAESQFYYPLVGRGFDLTADTSSINAGVSIGYDVPLHGFVLRYALGMGATVMYWDFGSAEPRLLRYYDSPSMGFSIVPGATLLWPHDWFQGGVGFRYLVQTSTAIPSGFLGELVLGVRL